MGGSPIVMTIPVDGTNPTWRVTGHKDGRCCSKVESKKVSRQGAGMESVVDQDTEQHLQIIYTRL